MPRHHVIISGTGRSGTTFLVQLLTALGLDTGFKDVTSGISPDCNAGMEWYIRSDDAPYVVKSPWLCDHLDEVVRDGTVVIDHALIPIRDLGQAAESRRAVTRKAGQSSSPDNDVPGGLWHTSSPEGQEDALARQFHTLVHTLAARDIPTTFLHFPRLVLEPDYLHAKLRFLLGDVSDDDFLRAFRSVSRPDLVHTFEVDASPPVTTPLTTAASAEDSGPGAQRPVGSTSELECLMAEYRRVVAHRDAIARSMSWRITAPLRKIHSLLRR